MGDPDVRTMYCSCGAERAARCDAMLQKVADELCEGDVARIASAVVYSLQNYSASITGIPSDMWSAVEAATYDGAFSTRIECDLIEHGLAGTWLAFKERFPEGIYGHVDDDDDDDDDDGGVVEPGTVERGLVLVAPDELEIKTDGSVAEETGEVSTSTPTPLRYHTGRAWVGHEIEDGCPCVKAPCGLVEATVPECPEHAPAAMKTFRQGHPPDECPGRSSWVSGPCPNCGALDTRQTYDIGSGPELSCAKCEWCWGAEGQDLNPVYSGSPAATRTAIQAHRDGHDVTLSYETGLWAIDGEPVVDADQDLVRGSSPPLEREDERVAPSMGMDRVPRTRSNLGSGDVQGRPTPPFDEERATVVARILEIEAQQPDPDRRAEWQALNLRLGEIDRVLGL
jgi:hypothetical protein